MKEDKIMKKYFLLALVLAVLFVFVHQAAWAEDSAADDDSTADDDSAASLSSPVSKPAADSTTSAKDCCGISEAEAKEICEDLLAAAKKPVKKAASVFPLECATALHLVGFAPSSVGLKLFQGDKGLRVDGVCGPKSRKALAEALAAKGGDEAGEDEAAVAPAAGGDSEELKKISSDLELIRSNQLAVSKSVSRISVLVGLEGYGGGSGEEELLHAGGGGLVQLNLRPSSRNILFLRGMVGSSGAGPDVGGAFGWAFEPKLTPDRYFRFAVAAGYRAIGLGEKGYATIGASFFSPGEFSFRMTPKPHMVEPWITINPLGIEYAMRENGVEGFQWAPSLSVAVEFDTSK